MELTITQRYNKVITDIALKRKGINAESIERAIVWHVAYHILITKQFDYHIMENINDKNEKQCAIHSVSNRFSDPKFIDNVCLSYRHDFGLLSEDEQNKVRFECKEWMRAIKNNEPY